jgi:SpoVK/Ycf46/Vps4 family AAA+-type ATPase
MHFISKNILFLFFCTFGVGLFVLSFNEGPLKADGLRSFFGGGGSSSSSSSSQQPRAKLAACRDILSAYLSVQERRPDSGYRYLAHKDQRRPGDLTSLENKIQERAQALLPRVGTRPILMTGEAPVAEVILDVLETSINSSSEKQMLEIDVSSWFVSENVTVGLNSVERAIQRLHKDVLAARKAGVELVPVFKNAELLFQKASVSQSVAELLRPFLLSETDGINAVFFVGPKQVDRLFEELGGETFGERMGRPVHKLPALERAEKLEFLRTQINQDLKKWGLNNVSFRDDAIEAALDASNAGEFLAGSLQILRDSLDQFSLQEVLQWNEVQSDIVVAKQTLSQMEAAQENRASGSESMDYSKRIEKLKVDLEKLQQKESSLRESIRQQAAEFRKEVTAQDLKPYIDSAIHQYDMSKAESSEHGQTFLAQFLVKDRPSTTFDDVGGREDVKAAFEEFVIFPAQFPEVSASNQTKPGGRILLEGGPGNGKTLTAMAAANAKDENGQYVFDEVYVIDANQMTSMWLGVGPNNWRRIFSELSARAAEGKRIYVFIDEFEVAGGRRGSGMGGASQERNAIVNAMLTGLNGFGSNTANITLVAATNRADMIDEALRRPGRFDEVISVGAPSLEERVAILKITLKGYVDQTRLEMTEEAYVELATKMDGFSGAHIKDYFGQVLGRILNRQARVFYDQVLEQQRNEKGSELTAAEKAALRPLIVEQMQRLPVTPEMIELAFQQALGRHHWELVQQGIQPPTPGEGSVVETGGAQ